MKNYTDNNLIEISSSEVQSGTLAIKIGNNVFTAGNVNADSMNFYKCASIDTTLSTWTGYKAILNDGIYSFEQNLTTDILTYDPLKNMPSISGIYTSDATVQVKYLYMGNNMLLYMPLTLSSSIANTGQPLTYNGTIDFDEIYGVNCGIFNAGENIQVTVNSDAGARSICMKMIIDDTNDWKIFLSYGTFSKRIAGNYDVDYPELYWDPGTWYSYILIFTGNELKEYLNGELKATRSYVGIPNGLLQIGGDSFRGKICDVKVYPSILSDIQISEESTF